MTDVAELLSLSTNFAVVQLPGRQYPGVVVQGDTPHSFVSQVAEMRKLLAKCDLSELQGEIIYYSRTCQQHRVLLSAYAQSEILFYHTPVEACDDGAVGSWLTKYQVLEVSRVDLR